MFDIGFWELLILFGLGLVVLGPERLPRVAMQVGNWAGQARRMARSLTAQMRAELDLEQNVAAKPAPRSRPSWQKSPTGQASAEPARTSDAAADDSDDAGR